MAAGLEGERDDRIALGYFANGGDAHRAVHELMDEGFGVEQMGAAFRLPRTGGGRMGPWTGLWARPEMNRSVVPGWFRGQRVCSEAAFEDVFLGLGVDWREAWKLSRELRCGGAVVLVYAGDRAALAEGILERNHGRVRLDATPGGAEAAPEAGSDASSRVEVYGRMGQVYRPETAERSVRRKAS
jgi:hypothetical protein